MHLGNYFAMMQNMLRYQEEHELYCFIASYHSLTSVHEPKLLREHVLGMAAECLAAGINPEKSIFWLQSDVPQVTELAWLLAQHISVPQLQLAHSYKDKISQKIAPSSALFFYPVLMAADILAFGSECVPVGQDQKQHLEMCCQMARRFHAQYGETFCIPRADIQKSLSLVPGIDGRKMSKSYQNAIYPFAPEKEIRKAVMSIVTDSKSIAEPKDPDNSVLYNIFQFFLDENGKRELGLRFSQPGESYGKIKEELYTKLLSYFAKERSKYEEIIQRPDDIRDILSAGAKKARQSAEVYLEKARRNVGLSTC